MTDKKKAGKQPTSQELALTTSTMAIPPIELVNRFQILNPTPANHYGSGSSLAYPPISQNYTPVNQIVTGQPSSSIITPTKSMYIPKPQLTNLFYIEPAFQHIKYPNELAQNYFPPDWHFTPLHPDKSILFYKTILEHTGSANFKPIFDTKDINVIIYQKIYIKKLISQSEWGSPFSLHPLPNLNTQFNYYDYINAWSYALLHENAKFSHSWFIQFDYNFSSPFPNWFLRWWAQFGAFDAIIPPVLLQQVEIYCSKQKFSPHLTQFPKLLHFLAKFKVAWIFCWKYVISDNILSRQFLVKWWDKLNVQQVVDQVTKELQPRIPTPIQLSSPPSPYNISKITIDSPSSSSPIQRKSNSAIIKLAQQLITQAAQNPDPTASKALLQIATDMLSQSQETEASS